VKHTIALEFEADGTDARLVFDYLWDTARRIEWIEDVTLVMDSEMRRS